MVSNSFFNKRIRGRFKQTAGRKNIFKVNWQKSSHKSEKPPPKEKVTSSKKALQSAPYKSAKIAGFQVFLN
jgi:hypothetical protein